jgi:uncharacterized protein
MSLSELRALHQDVDVAVGALTARHGAELACRRGCGGCCLDELTVFRVEAERLREDFAELLASGVAFEARTPGPRLPLVDVPAPGCAFLGDEGECRVYEARPYVCRTQGLPLRWFEEDERDEIVEQRDACPLNFVATPVESLDEEACFLVGPFDPSLERVSLRSLFARATR